MKTSGARPASVATWPSTSATSRAGSESNGLGRLRLEVDREVGAVDLAPDQRPARGRGRAPREPAPVLDHGVRLVVGEEAEVEAVEGRLADPAGRVENATRAPGSRASSHASSPSLTPLHRSLPPPRAPPASSCSRPRDLAVELAPQRRRQAAADRRALGNPGGDQVGAVDLERDLAPLEQVAVEPLGARARGRGRARPGRGRAASVDRLRGALRARSAASALGPLDRAEGGGEDRVGRGMRPPPRAGRPAARRRRRRARGPRRARSISPHSASSARPRTRLGLGARRAAARPRGGRRRRCRGRPRAAAPRSRARARSRTAPRSGRRGAPGSGRRGRSRGWRTRSRPASRSARPPWGSIRRGLAPQRDRHRVDREVAAARGRPRSPAPARRPGSAPGSRVGLGPGAGDVDLGGPSRIDLRGAEALVLESTRRRARAASSAASPTTTRSMSARPRPSSRSRTAPPTR